MIVHRYYDLISNSSAPIPDAASLGFVIDIDSGLCYKVHDVISGHVAAEVTCECEGGHLVTFDTEAKLLLFYSGMFPAGVG